MDHKSYNCQFSQSEITEALNNQTKDQQTKTIQDLATTILDHTDGIENMDLKQMTNFNQFIQKYGKHLSIEFLQDIQEKIKEHEPTLKANFFSSQLNPKKPRNQTTVVDTGIFEF